MDLVVRDRRWRGCTRRRAMAVVAAVAVLVAVAGACGSSGGDQVGTDGPGGWQALPTAPLSGRSGAVAIWDGHEVLVFGGFDQQAARSGLGTSSATVGGTTATAVATATVPTGGVPPSTPPIAPTPTPPATRAPGFPIDGAAFDPAARSWRALPAAPAPADRVATPVTTEGDRLTVMFARGATCGSDDKAPDPAGAWYDRETNAWRTIAAPSVPYLCSVSATWSGGRLWASLPGGLGAYDPATNRWQTFGDPPAAPDGCGGNELHAVGARIIAVGGRSVGPESSVACARAFDPASGTWAALPDPPVLDATAVAAGDRLYVVDNGTGEAAFWDESARAWSSLPDSPTGPRAGAVVTASDTSLVVWGGFDVPRRQGPSSAMLGYQPAAERSDGAVFDRARGSWRTIPGDGVSGRMSAAATTWAGTFFVWGGEVTRVTPTGSEREPLADGATFALGDAAEGALPPPAPTTTRPATPPQSAVGSPTTPPATAAAAPAAPATTVGALPSVSTPEGVAPESRSASTLPPVTVTVTAGGNVAVP